VAAVLLLLVGAGVAAALLRGDGNARVTESPTTTATPTGKAVDGELAPVPANRVRGVGDVKVTLTGNTAKVHLTANGLLNGFSHAMHIHAGAKGQCPPGSAAQVHNGFLSMTTNDGKPFYGHVITSLTTTGKTDSKSLLAFSRFPATGKITYDRTIRLDPVDAATLRQGGSAVVVIHGIDYNNSGSYDFSALDRSEENRKLAAEQTAPGLCGPLSPNGNRAASGTREYKTTLAAAPATGSSSFLCHLGSSDGKLL
jgi:hypothetical protein